VSATTPPVGLPSTIQALGGPAATRLAPWAILLVPTLILTAYQEIGVPHPSPLVRVLACVLPSVGSAVVFLIARALRRTTRTLPLALCILLWAGVGIAHGVTGGLIAALLTGAAAHYPARAAFWVASCLIWLPLVTYAVAQTTYRRELLASLESETRREQAVRRSSMWELAELRSVIVSTIRDQIRPELLEIARSLESIGPAIDRDRLAALGAQLSDVSEETTRIIGTTAMPDTVSPVVATPESVTPVNEALEFNRGRPLLSAALSSLALLPLVIAVSFQTADINFEALRTEALVVVVVTILLAVGLALQRLASHLGVWARIGWALAAFAVAGVAAAVVAAFGPWQPANGQNLVLAALLPIAVPLAAGTLAAAAGLGNANIGTLRHIRAVQEGIMQFNDELDRSREDIRNQVSAVTHGPLRGRLAACAMALNFHAAEVGTSGPARTEYIITSVREHLADVLEELDALW
jgi:heme exporter protein D